MQYILMKSEHSEMKLPVDEGTTKKELDDILKKFRDMMADDVSVELIEE